MAFSLPSDLAVDWADNVGMIEDAAYLNAVGAAFNAEKAALLGTVNNTAGAVVATSEVTRSGTYADLTTTTDSVTVTIGASGMALVMLCSSMSCNAGTLYVGYAGSGANTIAASDTKALVFAQQYGNPFGQFGGTFLETGLSAGSTVFKMKYRTSRTDWDATFTNRRIAVIPWF